jgi:hypothetical protein
MDDPSKQETEEEIEFRFKAITALGHPNINVFYRLVDLEEAKEAHSESIEEILTRLFNAETKIQVLESYGHVTGRKLNEARAKALTKHFQEMKLSPIKLEKSMSSGEMINYFENEAPEFLRIWDLKNPHKTVSDIRKKCIRLYPKNYSERKGKHGKNRWLLIYKD